MRAVGVIGAGQMGAGIAQVSAGAGYHVFLSDLNLAKAEEGKAGIAKALSRLVAKEKMSAGDAEALHLTAGEATACGGDAGVVAIGEFEDHVMGCGLFRGIYHGGRVHFGIKAGNVFGDGAIEELDALGQVANKAPQHSGVILVESGPIEADFAACGPPNASDCPCQ